MRDPRRILRLLLLPLLAIPSARSQAEETTAAPRDAPRGEPAAQNGCIACHENAPGELSRAVVEWRKSIHAEKGVTCDGCHGGDPEVKGRPDDRSAIDAGHFSPQGFVHRPQPASKISYFCGRCHAAIKEKHLGSPHGENVHPTCTYCHGHHAIRAPDTTIIDPSRCTTCHDFRNAAQIRKILENTQANIQALEEKARWLEENGYRTLALEEMHHHSRSTVTQLRVAFHSFHLGDVTNFASQLQAVLDQTQRTVDIVKRKNDARVSQTWIGLGAALFLFLFATLLMTYKRLFLDHGPRRTLPAALLLLAAVGLASCSTSTPGGGDERWKVGAGGGPAEADKIEQLDSLPEVGGPALEPKEEPVPASTVVRGSSTPEPGGAPDPKGEAERRRAPEPRSPAPPPEPSAGSVPSSSDGEPASTPPAPAPAPAAATRSELPPREPAPVPTPPPAGEKKASPPASDGKTAPAASERKAGPTQSEEKAPSAGIEEKAPLARSEGEASAARSEEKASPARSEEKAAPGSGDKTSRDFDKDCFRSGCHASLKQYPELHGPLLVGACETCHEALGGEPEHKFRLARTKETLCTSCHRPTGTGKFLHKPFEGSVCLDCHNPHGGKTRSLLASDNVGQLCGKCHEAPKQKVLHGPVAVGECLLCHNAHQSDHEKLLVAAGKDLCVKCHVEVGELVANAPYAHGPAAVDCSACHLPHGGEDRVLLRKEPRSLCLGCHDSVAEALAKDTHVHGAMDGEKGCAACHTPHASQFKSQLRAVAGDLCLTCHDKEIVDPRTKRRVANVGKQLASAAFKHGPVRTGDCQGCHFPHSSSFTKLLRESFPSAFYQQFAESSYSLCFRCHERTLVLEERTTTLTRFRDGDRNLHFLHVNRDKGRTCRACHEVHASNLPSHVRRSVPFGTAGWMLPINFEKTESGGACSPGCHKPKTYNNGGAAPARGTEREPPVEVGPELPARSVRASPGQAVGERTPGDRTPAARGPARVPAGEAARETSWEPPLEKRGAPSEKEGPAGAGREPAAEKREPAGDGRGPAAEKRDPAGDGRAPAARREPPAEKLGSPAGKLEAPPVR